MNEAGLNYLIDQAEKTRDTAGISLADERRKEEQLEQQLIMLQDYRTEYQKRLQCVLDRGTPLTVVRDYQKFLANLEKSIDEAGRFLNRQKESVTRSMTSLQQQQKKLSSFTTLSNRQLNTRQQEESRLEARQLDAMVSDLWVRNQVGR